MTYTMKVFIARNDINEFMKMVDLRPEHKVYMSLSKVYQFDREKLINEKFLMNLIKKSKENENFWIPAIEFCGTLYISPEIKELSDGERTIFIRDQKEIKYARKN